MTLTQVKLKRFTAFSDLSIDLSPGINVLVGANGTGKTHLMKVCYAACEASRPDVHFIWTQQSSRGSAVAPGALPTPLPRHRRRELERKLPMNGPNGQPWARPIASSCAVFNIEKWNEKFPRYPIERLSKSR